MLEILPRLAPASPVRPEWGWTAPTDIRRAASHAQESTGLDIVGSFWPVTGLIIGVDTGGTFTDTVVTGSEGTIAIGKVLSTPARPEQGVLDSLRAAARAAARAATTPAATTPAATTLGATTLGATAEHGHLEGLLARTSVLAHGTTVGLNALLTRNVARVGLITTAGFESTLAIAKANKILGLDERARRTPTMWDKPESLVGRRHVVGVHERIDASGAVIVPLDDDDVLAAVGLLVDGGVESIAVCLLWSIANAAHERRVGEVIARAHPHVRVALSSALAPRLGEYERMSTTVLDAAIGPLVASYLGRLETLLRNHGFTGSLLVARMDGSVQPAALLRHAPVYTLQSGPVAGVAAARMLGSVLGHRDVITADVGGTSFDVGLVVAGEVQYLSRPMIDRRPLALPVVDVTSIGTGGGSVAWIDERLRSLRVGPQSAGADPGPACYGRGGMRPTVTDAAAVLGYVDRLSGGLVLDADAARKAIETAIAVPLDMSVEQAADGILLVACEQMKDLVRRATVQRGHDPRTFALYVYGGAGPQYVGRFTDDLGVAEVVVPALASQFSAYGAAASELRIAVSHDVPPAPVVDRVERLAELSVELEATARAQLAEAFSVLPPGAGEHVDVVRSVGLRYYRQVNLIEVPVPDGVVDRSSVNGLVDAFRRRYEQVVGAGTSNDETPVELVRVSVSVSFPAPQVRPSRPLGSAARTGIGATATASRRAWFDGGWVDCSVHRWDDLGVGQAITGPAFIESDETAIVVYPGLVATIDAGGHARLARTGRFSRTARTGETEGASR